MILKPRSVATKLFFAFLLSISLSVLLIAVLIGQSMRSGFSDYLLQVELKTFDILSDNIVTAYQDQNLWSRLHKEPQLWHELVRSSLGPPGRSRDVNENSRRPAFDRQNTPPRLDQREPPPRQVDPLQLGRRLSLFDSNGKFVAGSNLDSRSYARRPIYLDKNDERKGIVAYLVLTSPLAGRAERDDRFLYEQTKSLIWVSLLAIFVSGLASFFLARNLVIPIRSLVHGTRELTAGNYSARLVGEGPDEIGRLVHDFNELAASLQAAEKAERQWLSDASHELKTPLAILKGRIEGLQDGVYKADFSVLSEMEHTVDRLNSLVGDLNLLAHAREGRMLLNVSEESLDGLIDDAVQDVKTRFAEKDLTIKSDVDQALLVCCDRMRVRQLLDNLLENSRRYTDGPGSVVIGCRSSKSKSGKVLLSVEDSAPCPPEEDVSRLFERFYRTDPSRARASGGSGLGLAICRAIVKAHGGSIEAKPSKLGGLRIEISLPISGPQKSN